MKCFLLCMSLAVTQMTGAMKRERAIPEDDALLLEAPQKKNKNIVSEQTEALFALLNEPKVSTAKLRKALKKGAQVDSYSIFSGLTPLLLAVMHDDIDAVSTLLENGADVNCGDQMKSLIVSEPSRNIHTYDDLLLEGKWIPSFFEVRDQTGLTALHLAALKGNISLCRLLIKNHADVEAITQGVRALKLNLTLKSVPSRTFSQIGIVALPFLPILKVFEKAFDVAIDYFLPAVRELGWTPLHMAALMGRSDVCSLLLENGAFVNAVTPSGKTPLLLAVENSNFALCMYLIKRGAKIDEGMIKIAQKGQENKIMELLIRCNGANK